MKNIFLLTIIMLTFFTGCSITHSASSLAGSSTSAASSVAWKYDDNQTIKLSSK